MYIYCSLIAINRKNITIVVYYPLALRELSKSNFRIIYNHILCCDLHHIFVDSEHVEKSIQ